jgi:hypothetical protein
VDQSPAVVTQPGKLSQGAVTVVASGRVVANVTSSGQYKPVTGSGVTAQQHNFLVQRVNGEWRIAHLPGTGRVSHELLLPESLFNLVYKPQNLYFYANGSGRQVLVPDPVFVPSDSSDPATQLVRALLSGIPDWLLGAAVSAFPAHTALLGVQVLPGPSANKTAIVSLRVPQAVGPGALRALDAQLVWTLTSRAYAQPLIHAVKLKVNGRFWPASGSAVLDLSDYGDRVPGPPAHARLYFAGANGGIRVLGPAGSIPVPGVAGQARVPMASIAVSPDNGYLAGVGEAGRTLYVSSLAAGAVPHAKPSATTPQLRLTGSSFTTPSWDRADNLWVAGRVGGIAGVWVLAHGRGTPSEVSLPPSLGPVTTLKVAPDGTRVAMIAGKGAAAHLVIASIMRAGNEYAVLHTVPVGPNISGPHTLAWYDPDHLLAVSGTVAQTQLWEVPANGNDATRQGAAQPGIVSVAAAGPENALYLGLSTGRLERSAGFGEFWSDLTAGSAATYPG